VEGPGATQARHLAVRQRNVEVGKLDVVALRRLQTSAHRHEQVATVMVARDRIAAAAQIDQSYSPGGASLHPPHVICLHGSLDSRESVPYSTAS